MATHPIPVAHTSRSKVSNPPLDSHSTALISSSASLVGTYMVTIGPHAIIQLRACVFSILGPIDIGEGCIISERAFVGSPRANQPQGSIDDGRARGVSLAQGVLVEAGASVEAASVGASTIIEAGASIGRGVVMGKNCKVCAKVSLPEGEVVGDNVVIYGSGWGERRVEMTTGLEIGKKGKWAKDQGVSLRRFWTGK